MEKSKGVIFFSIGVAFTLAIGIIFSIYTMFLTGRNPALTKDEKSLTDTLVEQLLIQQITNNAAAPVYNYYEQAPTITSQAPMQNRSKVSAVGNTIIDDNTCTIVLTDMYDSDIWGTTAEFQIKNKTNENLMFALSDDDVSMNGFMVTPLGAETIAGGKTGVMSICFTDKDLQNAGINSVNDIRNFTFSIHASNKNFNRVFQSEIFNLSF